MPVAAAAAAGAVFVAGHHKQVFSRPPLSARTFPTAEADAGPEAALRLAKLIETLYAFDGTVSCVADVLDC